MCQHPTGHGIVTVTFVALIMCFEHFTYVVPVLMLCVPFYRQLPDGDLLLKHVGGFIFVDNL
jgi:hypothetical protein